ncbi:MAG: FlgD immunoglobulin-like domain containing protein [Candidatus Cloacimonas sp.]|jgi:hypothetical protein|nr:FlgD immunoglobulin-like domain containing protein [Candidatus Cloacimonas sp.]
MVQRMFLFVLLLLCAVPIFALTGFSESNTFSITEETLPVELSSFTASITVQHYVQLTWITQSETNLQGFYVYRGSSSDLNSSSLVSVLIEPANSSSQNTYNFIDNEIPISGRYYYWLQSMEMNGAVSFHGSVNILVNLEDEPPGIPAIPLFTGIRTIYPNPFNPSTTISYQVQEPVVVNINIYNLRGQIVQSISRAHSTTGYFSLVFEGKDSSGNALPSGVYHVVLTAGKHSSATKIALMK